MKSFTFFMHNIYAMGGTVKSVTQLANTLAEKGHPVTIISVFRGADSPYFESVSYTHLTLPTTPYV